MEIDVKICDEALADLGRLSKPLLAEAYALLCRLKTEPHLGRELGDHPDVGDLTGCRKIYFDGTRWRIVYQLLPNARAPRVANVICVGRRANLAAYYEAARRLGRTPGVDAPPR